jgi:ketopantoate reductase
VVDVRLWKSNLRRFLQTVLAKNCFEGFQWTICVKEVVVVVNHQGRAIHCADPEMVPPIAFEEAAELLKEQN